MFDFLKKLFDFKDREMTVILLDDQEPESSNSYNVRPSKLFGLLYLVIGLTVAAVLFLVIFTPLGSLVYNKEDEQLRKSVLDVRDRVEALKDSLEARDQQLREIQDVLAAGEDTVFQTTRFDDADPVGRQNEVRPELNTGTGVNAFDMISQNEILFSGILSESPDFPAPYPVEGTLTRNFSQNTGHLGIDIATKEEKEFRAIANGSVINRDWTVSYGYILQIQHGDGIISIYKHASDLSKQVGEVVMKGEILGSVGYTGVMSSGPHLHLEIWKNGVPQNPLMYLIKS